MKNNKLHYLLLLAAYAVGISSCAQQKVSGKELGKEICSCLQKADELPYESDAQKSAKLDCNKKQGGYWLKVNKDKTEEFAFNKELAECVIKPKLLK